MSKLEELYAERETFLKYGQNVPAPLAEAITEAEKSILDRALEVFTGHLPNEIELPDTTRIVFGAEYSNGKLISVGSSYGIDMATTFEVVKMIPEEEETEETKEKPEDNEHGGNDPDEGRKRGPSIGFKVKFADGKEIEYSTARRTMIEALRYIGLERASKYRGEMFKGYPLVGRKQRPDSNGHSWQKNIDGWWIYVNLSNNRAITCLKGVAELLGIDMEIIKLYDESEKTAEKPTPTFKIKGKRSLFSINGSEPLPKNRAVHEAVCLFMHQFPDVSFVDIEQMFPRSLQGSYGVIRTIDEIRQRGEKNRTESARWFLEPEEILSAADGMKFAVCNEWGDNFDKFLNHIKSSFGWTVEEV